MREFLRWVVLGGLFLLPFVPLIVTGSLFFSYITGKNFAFRIIVEIVFAAWFLLALLDAKYRPHFSWVFASFAAFVGVMFVANVFGETPLKSFWSNFERMEGWVTLVHLFAYFVVAGSVLRTEAWWHRFFNTILISAFLTSLVGLSQVAGLSYIAQSGVRIEAWLGNAIYMAGYMLFTACIALFLLVREKRTWVRALYGALAVLFMFLLVQTATRGTIIALALALAVTAGYAAYAAREHVHVRRLALGALALIVLLSGAFYFSRESAFVERSPIWSRIASISLAEGQTRLTIWRIALEGIKERPLLGWGQSNFDYVFDQYYEPSLYAQEPYFDRVHNIVLDWLIAGGIVGFLAYAGMWAAALHGIRASSEIVPFSPVERGLLFGLLAGYGVHNLFAFDNLVSYTLFATLLAFLHVRTAREMPRIAAFRMRERTVQYVAVPTVAALLAVVVYWVNIPHLAAGAGIIDGIVAVSTAQGGTTMPSERYNALLARGFAEFRDALARDSFAGQEVREQLALAAERIFLDARAPTEAKQAYRALAEAELLKQVALQPRQARARAFLGSFYRITGETEKALAVFRDVQKLTPRKPAALLDIGLVYFARAEYPRAKEVFREAFILAPQYEAARARYIAAAVYTGDDALVRELSAPPYEALYRDDDLILQAYYELRRYGETLAILDARMAARPEDIQTRISKAAIQHESGDTTGAIATLRQAAKEFPAFAPQAEQFIKEIGE